MREGTAPGSFRCEVVVPGEILAIATDLSGRREVTAALERSGRTARQKLRPDERSRRAACHGGDQTAFGELRRTDVRARDARRLAWLPSQWIRDQPLALLPIAAGRILDRIGSVVVDRADEMHALADSHAARERNLIVLIVTDLGDATLDIGFEALESACRG